MKKHLVRIILGFFCLAALLGHAGRLWHIPFVSALDAYLYDVRVRISMPDTPDDRIVIVDIDEKSLAEIGRWPWGRNVVSDLVRKLTDDYQVSVIGFDVVFAEPDDSSGLKVLESIARDRLKGDSGFQRTLKSLRPRLDYDRLFAETLRGRPAVLGYYFSGKHEAKHAGALPQPVFPAGSFAGRDQDFVSWEGFGGNLPGLQAAAAGAGHFNPLIDFDGSTRRVPLVVKYQDAYYESLSLAMIRQLLGESQLSLGFPDDSVGIEWIDILSPSGNFRIPVDEQVAALVPYRGQAKSFPYISAVDILRGQVSADVLRGRIVLVGTSAPGLMDLRSTPVGGAYPGVEVHANLIAGMLSDSIKARPGYMLAVEILSMILLGCALVLLLPLLSPLRSSLLALTALALAAAFNYGLWQGGLVLALAPTFLLIVILYALNMSWGYFVESRSKRQFTDLFGQYVPPELVDEMAKDPESYSMEGRNEELTILFSDIRSFTTLSEGMTPRELTQLMNEYLGAMTSIVRTNRGTLDKYIGDAIMAFWGAPVADPENARHALLTALAMQQAVRALDAPFKARGWPELHIGVGLNTGVVTVGDMGSPVRKAYTVMGDAVNLASRLEGITKVYGVGIVVGEATRDKLDDFSFRELDRVRVKGKEQPVTIFEPLGLSTELSPEDIAELAEWENFLHLYRAQDWVPATQLLLSLQQRFPARYLYKFYAERIAELRLLPIRENWDGVTAFETK
ncbi:CHASE2 domain-containing protein [Azonexus sp.]|uniref:CHASE2 domain-containing protein n=1 Tax=Azonexus sp. TaxID=1872668 RepID=UPI0027B9C8DD|nr:adenylate/guanylate cyclase domain-containing protein [Azonexus sp.]